MTRQHHYSILVQWKGNLGQGTSSYHSYERSHTVTIAGKPDLDCSSDVAFMGDKSRYNPEELLVASLSSCHMLWYLHLCAEEGVVVLDYADDATGSMAETSNGGGYFTEVVLSPAVIVAEASMVNKANELHKKANELCFIAKSVNFPVRHRPSTSVIHDR
jgi:organic hydroperoxide reductase OsmC/OhrA